MNYFKFITILLVCGTVNGFAAEKNTVASWSFEALKNGAVKDSIGNHDAVASNAVIKKGLIQPGLFGKAIKMLKGRNMLVVKHQDDLSLTDNFTIKCVFNPDKVDSYRTLIWKGDRTAKPQRINYYINIRDGKLEFKFKDTSGKWTSLCSKPLIEVEKWYNLTISFAKGRIIGYLNGKVVINAFYRPAKLVPNKDAVYIGAGQAHNGGGTYYSFDGLIDELSIMNGIHPPTTAEIKKFDELKKKYESLDTTAQEETNKKKIAEIVADEVYGKKFNHKQLQKFSQEELDKLSEKCRYRKFFNSSTGAGSFIATTLKTVDRIVSPDRLVNENIKLSSNIELTSAKNEYEGFQIILLGNPDRDIDDIQIKLNSLLSKDGKQIPADQIEWGYVKTIRSDRPGYDTDFVGEIPDVIMEGQTKRVKVKAGWLTPVYVRIKVNGSVPAGIYKGCVNVSSKGQSRNINVSLKIYDFKLPVTTSLKIAFSFFEGSYRKWYGHKGLSDQQKMYIYDFLLKYRITPNNIYSNKIYPELRFMKKLKAKGANFCTLGYLIKAKKVSEQALDDIIVTYRKRINEINKAGFGDITYLYAFDELGINSKNLAAANQIMTRFKKEFPKIKTIQTSFPKQNILKYFDVWVPLFCHFASGLKEVRYLEKQGKEFWWYSADIPLKPYPNFFLDYPVFDNRIIMTLSYMYNVKGVLYWCINREWSTNFDIKGQWPGKRWKPYIINCFTKKRQFKNGMGNYVYPGRDGRILPSLRLENLRDGIEDYEYLMILKKRVAVTKARQGNTALVKQAEKLLKVPANVAVAVDSYSANPENLLKYRNNVASMIEKFNKKNIDGKK